MTTVERPDWTDILPTESLIEWLQRTDPTRGWILDGDNFQPIGPLTPGDDMPAEWQLRPMFSEAAWNAWRDHATAAALAAVKADTESLLTNFPITFPPFPNIPDAAPVWPGLDDVTLGTPVALASGVTITEQMDGVIIEITGTDPDFNHYYTYDDLRAYRNVGALVFLDDQGHAEGFQPIGFVSAVYCPRSMKHAEAVKLKCGHGLTGTVTPWLWNGPLA